MKTNFAHMTLAALCCLLCACSLSASAQSKDSVITDGGPPPALGAAPRVQWPGPMHGLLDQLAGRWRTRATVWPQGSAATALYFTGSSDWYMLFSGRFLELRDSLAGGSGSWLNLGYMGYDEGQQRFTFQSHSNFGAGLFSATGGADDSARVFTFDGTAAGEPVRVVLRMITGNHRQLDIFRRERKVAEIEYRRTY